MPFPLVAAIPRQASNNSRPVLPLFIFAHLVSLSFLRNFHSAWAVLLYQPYAPNGAKSKRTFMP